MNGLTIALIAGSALVLAACGGNNYRSNFSSDWCLSTDGLTFEESVWANEVCSRGSDGDGNTFSNDGDDSPGNGSGGGRGGGRGGGNGGGRGGGDCPGNSCDAPGQNK